MTAVVEQLGAAGPGDRPRVLRAALVDGASYRVEEADRVLDWLVRHDASLVFSRWIAEDARWGGVAYATLARREPTRSLQRAPVWLAPGRASAMPADLMRGWSADLAHQAAVGFRFGSLADLPVDVPGVVAAARPAFRPAVRFAVWAGRRRPTAGAWRPTPEVLAAAARWRRWPLPSVRGDTVGVCARCGEPSDGDCRFCGGRDVRELRLDQLLAHRETCAVCGIDRTTAAAPTVCGGCGA